MAARKFVWRGLTITGYGRRGASATTSATEAGHHVRGIGTPARSASAIVRSLSTTVASASAPGMGIRTHDGSRSRAAATSWIVRSVVGNTIGYLPSWSIRLSASMKPVASRDGEGSVAHSTAHRE